VRFALALLAIPAAWPGARAHAQSYHRSPFGSALSQRVSPYPSLYGPPFVGPFSPYQPQREPDDAFGSGYSGTYRTLCVRMCDGYYFPISFSTQSSGLSRDAEKCAASCGEQARLFFHPNPGGDIETMIDLTGRAYATLPNAFVYRSTLVQGCRCRPLPWSETERRRHRAYAEDDLSPVEVLRPANSKSEAAAVGSGGKQSAGRSP